MARKYRKSDRSKTIYYRDTDPDTGKQYWVKLEGITTNGKFVYVDPKKWKNVTVDELKGLIIVYKTPRGK